MIRLNATLAFAAERQVVRQTPVTSAFELTLVVLRCADLERTRTFYEALGFTLTAEQHGSGPRHYCARLGETVLEFYPDASGSTRGLRLGLRLVDVQVAVSAAAERGAQLVLPLAEIAPTLVELASR